MIMRVPYNIILCAENFFFVPFDCVFFFIDCLLDVDGDRGILAKRGKLGGVFGSVYLMSAAGVRCCRRRR